MTEQSTQPGELPGREREISELQRWINEGVTAIEIAGPPGVGKAALESALRASIEVPDETTIHLSRHLGHAQAERSLLLTGLAPDAAAALYSRLLLRFGGRSDDRESQEQADALRALMLAVDGLPAAIEAAAQSGLSASPSELLEILADEPLWFHARLDQVSLPAQGTPAAQVLAAALPFAHSFDVSTLVEAQQGRLSRALATEGLTELLRQGHAHELPGAERRFRIYNATAHRCPLSSEALQTLGDRCRALRNARHLKGGAAAAAELAGREPDLRAALRLHERSALPDELVTELLVSLAIALQIQGRPSEAMDLLRSLPAIDDPGDDDLRAHWALLSAWSAEAREGVEAARAILESALSLGGALLLEASELRRRAGDLEAAGELIEVALGDDDPGVRRAARAYAAANQAERGRPERAREHLDDLLSLRPGPRLDLECKLWQRVSYACHYLRSPDEQRRACTRAYEIATELQDPQLRSLCALSMADNAYVRGAYDEARAHYEEAIPLLHAQSASHRLAVALGNLATLRHRHGELVGAYDLYMDALTQHRLNGSRAYEAVVLFALAALHHEQARIDDGVYRYRQACSIYEAISMPFDLGATLISMAWLVAAEGRFLAARDKLLRAREIFDDLSAEHWAAVCDWTLYVLRSRGLLKDEPAGEEPPRLKDDATRGAPPSAAFRLIELLATGPADPAEPPSLYERLLVTFLRAPALEAAPEPGAAQAPAPATPAPQSSDDELAMERWDIAVGPECRWFQIDGEEAVDLRRRSSLRRVLAALIEAHQASEPQSLDVHELFDAGWPGEEIHSKSISDRVYWAIRTLRELGLRDLLLTTDEGYLLDRAARVQPLNHIENV